MIFWYHRCHYPVIRSLGADGRLRYATPTDARQVVVCPHCHLPLEERYLHPGSPWPGRSAWLAKRSRTGASASGPGEEAMGDMQGTTRHK